MWDQLSEQVVVLAGRIDSVQVAYAFAALGLSIVLGFAMHYAIAGTQKIWGNYKMKKRAKMSQEFRELLEDYIVEALSVALTPYEVKGPDGKMVVRPPVITLDEARVFYSKMAHLGFWGLHPRKFTPKKTPEELDLLKQQLKANKAARAANKSSSKTASASSIADKMLDGIDAELA